MLWRQQAGLTQQALAKRAGIPQPNLSAIEWGKRDVSLGTMRALAATLGVRPGILADGVPPALTGRGPVGARHPLASKEGASSAAGHRQGSPVLSRQTIERIADAVAFDQPVTEPNEHVTVDALRELLGHRTLALRRQWSRPRTARRQALAAWIRLKSLYGRSAIQTLADRVLERQRANDARINDSTND